MDVEDPPLESLDKGGGQDPHESGQDHSLGSGVFHGVGQRGGKGVPVGVVVPPDDVRRNADVARPLQGGCVRPVGDHGHDATADRRGVDERLEIGPRSRCEYCDVDFSGLRVTDAAAV